MNYGIKRADNGNLEALATRAGAKITGAIQSASAKTGVGFSYLLQQANVESSFRADAKAKGSSATGLYQFIESTWLAMVRDHGDKYGLGTLADKISENGRVASQAVRSQILALRKDPEIASAMAAEYASDNKDYLESKIGREVGSTELYMAHFMGPGGAAKFLNKMNANPDAAGARAFPAEACSNPSVFYNKNGFARSLSQIYAFFDNKFQNDGGAAPAATAYADASSSVTGAKTKSPSSVYKSARANIFDENTGSWFSTSNPKDVKWAALAPRPDGSIPGLQNLLANPVDVLRVMELADTHNNADRYNA